MDRMAVQRVMNLFSPAQTVVPPGDVPVSHSGILQKIGRKLKVRRLLYGIHTWFHWGVGYGVISHTGGVERRGGVVKHAWGHVAH